MKKALRGSPFIAAFLGLTFLWLTVLPFFPDGRLPDATGAPSHILVAAGWFLFWSYCTISWGLFLRRSLLPSAPLLLSATILGTLWAAVAAFALGLLGLIGPNHRILLEAILFLGPSLEILAATLATRSARASTPRERAPLKALNALIVLVVGVYLLAAAMPQGHPDPLYYDLVGPRLWSQAGRIFFPQGLLFIHCCGPWDFLGIWPQSLLGGPEGRGLIEAQLFMQWVHAGLGAGGCALALARFLRHFSKSDDWARLATLAGLTTASVSWTAWLAKNDWGASFWVLGGAALLLEESRGARRFIVAGAAVGLGMAAKYTTAFTALPLLALICTRMSAANRKRLACGVALGLAPPLVFNLIETGNPFFPALNRFFHSDLINPALQSLLERFEGGGVQVSAHVWLFRTGLLLMQNPLIFLFFVPPVGWLISRKRHSPLKSLWFACLASLLLFQLCVGSGASLRLAGPGMLLAGAVSVLALEEVLAQLALTNKWARISSRTLLVIQAAILIETLAFGRLPWAAVPRAFAQPEASTQIKTTGSYSSYPFEGGDALAWLRSHARDGEPILLPDDNRIYYISHLNFVCVFESARLQALFAQAGGPREALETMRSLGVRYVLSQASWEWGWESRLRRSIKTLIKEHPEAVTFFGRDATVLNLAALKLQ